MNKVREAHRNDGKIKYFVNAINSSFERQA